eukprot:6205718-Pleurochrysis_carterae.AAC.13
MARQLQRLTGCGRQTYAVGYKCSSGPLRPTLSKKKLACTQLSKVIATVVGKGRVLEVSQTSKVVKKEEHRSSNAGQ